MIFLCTLHTAYTLPVTFNPQKIAMVGGAGYVGLVSGSGLASIGHFVTCVDINSEKIEALNCGSIPIYEPNLKEIITQNVQEKRLSFSSNVEAAIKNADIIMIAVDTPMDSSGKADLSALNKALAMIGILLTDYKIICIKSTVPVGTNQAVKKIIKQCCGHENFDVIANPEFLREGCALSDFFEKNPIVLGGDSEKALKSMEALYQPLLDKGRTLIKTNFATAELIKYAWNAFSSIKVSFVNELSHMCNKVNADIASLIFGMSFSDELLPVRNVIPGAGIGGSCLPKDCRAFVAFGEEIGAELEILKASIQSDLHHKQKIIAELYNLMDNKPERKKVTILGLSFKANTDDIRSSPAIMIIAKLLADGAHVVVYDPQAMEQMKKLFPEVTYCDTAYQAVRDADVLLMLTDWDEFKTLDFRYIAGLMKQQKVMDTKNMWSPLELKSAGFIFKNLGKI